MLVFVRPSKTYSHIPIFSERAGIVSTACIEGPLLYRGASASTETVLAFSPSILSEGARSGSTGLTWVFSHSASFLHVSLGEWPRLPSTARIGRAHSYRARSASKEGTWPLPSAPGDSDYSTRVMEITNALWSDGKIQMSGVGYREGN